MPTIPPPRSATDASRSTQAGIKAAVSPSVARSLKSGSERRISVIIPAWNEADRLLGALACLADARDVEIIVVDAGSSDGTRELADSMGCRTLATSPGRGKQMNAGAAVATGSLLLFLHADTRLPEGFDQTVRNCLNQPQTIAGAFRLRLDDPRWSMRLMAWGTNARCRSFGVPYGDQAIFLRATDFQRVSGFREMPIMEDYEFMCRLRRLGRIALLDQHATTSARRWQRLGPWKTMLVNQAIIAGYRLGFSPERLARWYGRQRTP